MGIAQEVLLSLKMFFRRLCVLFRSIVLGLASATMVGRLFVLCTDRDSQ